MTQPLVVATPRELLEAARELVTRRDDVVAGRWARAAALLGRQAIEHAIDDFWRSRFPGVEKVQSMHPKLLCLATYMDEATAGRAAHAWVVLSRACHITAYELAPTADELRGWLDGVAELLNAVDHAALAARE